MKQLLINCSFAFFVCFNGFSSEVLSLKELAKEPLFTFEVNQFSERYSKSRELKPISEKGNVYRLIYFDYGYLGNLPFTSEDFPNLQELIIMSCHNSFPKEILGFKKIQVLSIKPLFDSERCSNRYDFDFPQDFFSLKHLKIVDFRTISVSYLPEEISKLDQLIIFIANTNASEELESTIPLQKEEEQSWFVHGGESIAKKRLKTLPLSIPVLPKLQLFAIFHSTELLEWKLFRSLKPNAIFETEDFLLYKDSIVEGTDLFEWYMTKGAKKKIKKTAKKLPEGAYSLVKDSLIITGHFVNQLPTGKWEFRVQNKLRQTRNYDNQRISYQLYDSNDMVSNSWSYFQNMLVEVNYKYYPNDSVYTEEHFRNGISEDTSKMFFQNGALKASVETNNDARLVTLYSENNEVYYQLNIEKESRDINSYSVWTYTYNDSLSVVDFYKNGYKVERKGDTPHVLYHYDSLGQVIMLTYFDSFGKKSKTESFIRRKGIVFEKIIHEFYPNGKYRSESFFNLDQTNLELFQLLKNGIWRIWDENGQLISETEYSIGKEIPKH